MCTSTIPCVLQPAMKPFIFAWFFMAKLGVRFGHLWLAFAVFWWMNFFFERNDEWIYSMCKTVEHFPEWFRRIVNWHPVLSERDFLSVCFLGICIKVTLSMLSNCLLKCWEEFCLWIKYAMGSGRPFLSQLIACSSVRSRGCCSLQIFWSVKWQASAACLRC